MLISKDRLLLTKWHKTFLTITPHQLGIKIITYAPLSSLVFRAIQIRTGTFYPEQASSWKDCFHSKSTMLAAVFFIQWEKKTTKHTRIAELVAKSKLHTVWLFRPQKWSLLNKSERNDTQVSINSWELYLHFVLLLHWYHSKDTEIFTRLLWKKIKNSGHTFPRSYYKCQ